MREAALARVRLTAGCDVLELDVVLVEVLDDANVVVLDVTFVLSGKRVIRDLRAVETTRVRLNHVVEHLSIQILGVSHLGILLLSNVHTVVQRLQAYSG